ncbi:MAG: rhodanese-like domain-containing protein [Gemmatimonadales bacterium]
MRTTTSPDQSLASRSRAVLVCLLLSTVVVSALIPARMKAQATKANLLVTPEWLGQHLNDPNLVLLHVGPKSDYNTEHIRGARFVEMGDIADSDHEKPGGLMLQVPSAESLRDRLANLGISDDSRVIVYYGTDWVTPATRVVFTLDFAGLGAKTSILDGGMGLWKEQKRPVTKEIATAKKGALSALNTRPIVVDADWVKGNIGKAGISVVDGRASAFYDGVETGRGMQGPQRTGHIAGAKSIPYTEVTNDKVVFKTRQELEAIFVKAGVKPGDTVVGYCHIGQQATGMLFAARLLGHKVLLYDGSFEDWSAHTAYPVATGAAAK